MKKIIDLSHFINENMTVYPGSPKPVLEKVAGISTDGFNELGIKITSHTGTHIDAPSHLIAEGRTLDAFNAEQFYGIAYVINCTGTRIIRKKLIEETLQNKELLDFLIFNTGRDQFWEDEFYFADYPVPDTNASEFISHLPVKGIGIDAPSIDIFHSKDLPNHNIFLGRNVLLIENLCNLGKLPSEIIFCCFPLKIENSDGAPARAVGIFE